MNSTFTYKLWLLGIKAVQFGATPAKLVLKWKLVQVIARNLFSIDNHLYMLKYRLSVEEQAQKVG